MNANRTKSLLKSIQRCSNHEFLLEQLKITTDKTVACFYDIKGHAQTCFERYCELANEKTKQRYEVPTLCLDDHHFKKEELESVGELSKESSQIILKCFDLARSGGLDI